MPLHLPALTRRRFLQSGAAAFAGLAALPAGWGAEAPVDPDCFALLADTHIAASAEEMFRDTNMADNLRRVTADVLARPHKPAAVIVNGDCAFRRGLSGDYQNFSGLIAPFAEAGLPVHLTLGNHDDRASLYNVLTWQRPRETPVTSKHVGVVESPHANWFLLDSLFQVNVVTGNLGELQRKWLARALDDRRDKPAIVVAHHTPQFEPPPEGKPVGGLQDTAEFFELLGQRPHVKAFIYGHSHVWEHSRRNNLHLVNLPPVAHVFTPGLPNGWVEARLTAGGLNLTLHTLDPNHEQSEQRVELAWA